MALSESIRSDQIFYPVLNSVLNVFYLFSCIFSHVLVYFIIFCSVFLQQNSIK